MTNLTHSFSTYLFHAFTCFEQQVLIIRRTKLCQYIIWYKTLWWVIVWRGPACQTVTHQSVLYQMMYWHNLVLLMMSTCCSKHVEAWNKYIEKECVKLDINQNYVEMHGQQNIKTMAIVHSSLYPAVADRVLKSLTLCGPTENEYFLLLQTFPLTTEVLLNS
jgi:hypothetical protein